MVRKGTLTRWAERAARDAAGRVFAAGRAHGFAGVRLYDWFWLFERYRRMNPVPAYFDYLLPFADIGFVNTALSVDISEHRAHRLHRELTAALVPRWRDAPYFKPAPGRRRGGATSWSRDRVAPHGRRVPATVLRAPEARGGRPRDGGRDAGAAGRERRQAGPLAPGHPGRVGDGAVGRTRGAERLGARLAALRRVAERRGRPIGLG